MTVEHDPSQAPSREILLHVPDLMAETRVLAALAADGLAARAVGAAEWPGAVAAAGEAAHADGGTAASALAVVDLTAPGAVAAIAAAVAAGLTAVAFGPHVDTAALEAARAAGAARVLARGDFLQHAARRVREVLAAAHGSARRVD